MHTAVWTLKCVQTLSDIIAVLVATIPGDFEPEVSWLVSQLVL